LIRVRGYGDGLVQIETDDRLFAALLLVRSWILVPSESKGLRISHFLDHSLTYKEHDSDGLMA
jgi:hypothetical protein